MGILNVTPDSFSDGGRWLDTGAAIAHAVELREQGADLIDVGGESTRPGADRVPIEDEQRRVLPVVAGLVERGIEVSVDTMNADTARRAADTGAAIINDVSGGLSDPEMYRAIAGLGVRYIAMHWRGHSDSMNELAVYGDVVRDVVAELTGRVAEMLVWGIDPARIILDPGLGFAKTAEHNWQLLRGLGEIEAIGHPVLVGASRKRFLAPFAPEGAPSSARDAATATISALAAQAGVWAVRVHNVPATAEVLDVWRAWESGGHHE
ncbi:dihydropteroate synthase [Galbitalea soli]|uniref:dihydropteroate synthase n=2 Tax=Galbitalea soli TaxID=1268042 RepID=A0A7C9PNY2_9MICO|nr:dihydropteroate synthase [Galbitalea soli]NEM91993.1 dihydropteroate synthase [Galbitalea soli]